MIFEYNILYTICKEGVSKSSEGMTEHTTLRGECGRFRHEENLGEV